jgi:hypothetical protein
MPPTRVVTENRVKKSLFAFAARGGLVPSCHPHPHCTPFAPHKQLLVAAVGGAVVVVVLRSSLSSCPQCHSCHPALIIAVVLPFSSLLSCHPHPPVLASPPGHCCHSTHYPPHEQLLVRLGVGGVSSIIVVCHCCLLSLFIEHY